MRNVAVRIESSRMKQRSNVAAQHLYKCLCHQRLLTKARKQKSELIPHRWPERLHHQLPGVSILAGCERINDRDAYASGYERAGRIRHERVDTQFSGDARLFEHAVDDVTQAAVAHERDEIFACKVFRHDERLGAQAMTVWNDANSVHLAQHLVADGRVIDWEH